ncbi:SagB/ThcOx family dehydrogenase [Saccharothrix algeriensis]|uniref:SagB-type dehydrogenase family enzyme n=1 Tax=Saccharothrix algeriensis TaxID=173560 RepID=A0A8T8HZU3_9PSEU|nr:SagB/ThcOx family dehydrogenase [Saccharothrix algeriensis]MBM7809419.1 SagB-type dehydrogenase family enzyme [Saccharothrix algeriensis]QTR03760.1 SagB/ThcOx family dehydrogenase [Saccharothrix algeriensis]
MIALPDPAEPTARLTDALRSRRSRYSYGPLDRRDLSGLLRFAVGVQRHVPPHVLGLNPTAGGLPSLGVHVVLDGEVCEYLREPHALRPVGKADLAGVFAQEEFARRARAVIVLTGRMGPGLAKYGPRHHRTAHLDAGVALQNLYLVATALGLPCCAVAGFADDAVKALVGAAEQDLPLALFVVGGPVGPGIRT